MLPLHCEPKASLEVLHLLKQVRLPIYMIIFTVKEKLKSAPSLKTRQKVKTVQISA